MHKLWRFIPYFLNTLPNYTITALLNIISFSAFPHTITKLKFNVLLKVL